MVKMRKLGILCGLLLMLSGCSIQKMAGGKVLDYTHDEAIPYLMAQSDVAAACSMGQSMGPVVSSMSRVELSPENVGIATNMASGMCAEFDQRNAELDRVRALHDGLTSAAQDALIREKQAHWLAAQRMIRAYYNAVETFGDFTGENCPKYESSTDELLSLLGIASGALALLHDFNSEKAVGISLDIPVRIEKAAACFSDDKWWGMPTALRASIWLSIPGSGPEGVDPLEAMQKAAKKGDKQGVILARAMLAMMANIIGNKDVMCQALAEMPDADSLNHDYDMLNAYARGMLQHHADVSWTKDKGYRAPFMQVSCPVADQATSTLDENQVDDLLDGLMDEEEEVHQTQEVSDE